MSFRRAVLKIKQIQKFNGGVGQHFILGAKFLVIYYKKKKKKGGTGGIERKLVLLPISKHKSMPSSLAQSSKSELKAEGDKKDAEN